MYVSYAKTDADFVDHNLAPTLEHGPRATYRLCLHHRDFPQDSSIYDTVSLASESSAKILIVLSKAYLAEEWCAVRQVISDCIMKNGRQLVILCLDNVSDELRILAPELLPYPCIKWGSNGFMNKLRFFLPEPVHTTFQRSVTMRSIQQQQQNEHLYHYIAEYPRQPQLQQQQQQQQQHEQQIYHTLQEAKTNFALLRHQNSFENPAMTSRQLGGVCHTHSLSTSSGQRLLTNPEEYIV